MATEIDRGTAPARARCERGDCLFRLASDLALP